MAKKYLKNSKGVVSAITTDNLQLEKPLVNENYDIEVFNRNMDKIDSAIIEDKSNISSLQSNISSLQTKVNNGQNHKLTQDNGSGISLTTGYNLNNLNDIGTGFYYGQNFKNAPVTGWGMIEHIKYSNSATQRYTVLYDGGIFVRRSDNGIWSDWREL